MPDPRRKSIKTPHITGEKHIDRALKAVYDDINHLIESVNTPAFNSEISTRDGKPGDIRVVKDSSFNIDERGGNSGYFIEAKTEDGWVRQYMDRTEHSGISRSGTIPLDLLKMSTKKQIKQGKLSWWKSDSPFTGGKSAKANSHIYADEHVVIGGDVTTKALYFPAVSNDISIYTAITRNSINYVPLFYHETSNSLRYKRGVDTHTVVASPHNGGILFLERADHENTPAAGKGELWLKSTTPSTLIYTDDAGTDFNLAAGEANVVTALNNQAEDRLVTIGSTTTQLDGEANLSYTSDVLSMSSTSASKPYINITNTANDATAGGISFTKNRAGVGTDGDLLGQLLFFGEDSGSGGQTYAHITASISESNAGDEAGTLKFMVASGTSSATTIGPDALVLTGAKAGQTNYVSDGHCELQITDTAVGFVQEALNNSATGTTTNYDVDFRKCNKFHLTSAGDITNLKCYFPSVSGNFLLIIDHGAGDQITNWKSFDEASANETNFYWPDGNKFLCSSTAAVDIVSIYWDSTNHKAYAMAAMNFETP